jgi:CubicO group peptidase (beta-lactamase class C family)
MQRKHWIAATFLGAFAITAGGLVAFGGFGDNRSPASYTYVAPKKRSDGIAVANAATLGIDTSRIREMVRPYLDGRRGNHTSLLVMKDGKLIVEEYFHGWKYDRPHIQQSVSKSLTSLMIGWGIARGYITSVDDPIAKYLPKYRHLLVDGKEKITIRHLLTMTSGLDWDEATRRYTDSLNTRIQHARSDDGTAFTLGRKLAAQPGETWTYNGGGITILAEILGNVTGLPPGKLVDTAFAGLLDKDEIDPTLERDGRMNSSGGLEVTPRGMIKIGQMLLQHGQWNGRQIFDSTWIEESTDAALGRTKVGYGYAWWRQAFKLDGRWAEAIVGNGYGGQHIYAFPALDMIVVVTATNYDHETRGDTTLEGDVFPALGQFHLTQGRPIDTGIVDSASAFPPKRAVWSRVYRDSSGALGVYTSEVDRATARRLDDGSWLVWVRSTSQKPRTDLGWTYDRLISRFILSCATPTDARLKRVSSTGFLGDQFAFQDYVGVDSARAQPWVAANANSPDVPAFRKDCEKVKR